MEEKKSFKEFLCSKGGKAVLIIVLYAIIFVLLMLTVSYFTDSWVFWVYVALFSVCGWKALNRIQPNIFLFMPLVGWIIYFVVKGLLSLTIGMFVAPFVISKKITETIQKNL